MLPASNPEVQYFPQLSATFPIRSFLAAVVLGYVASFIHGLKVQHQSQSPKAASKQTHTQHTLFAAAIRTKREGANRTLTE